ncbi:mitochondrial fission ELM1 family protein [Candidatus Pelagibacter sp.]|nr:mitochondrial fission ELM1 family protein [Candidatus Pelagibacter sp.]
MNKLKGLLLTEGLHGMISQVEGLAKALDLDYFHEKVELNSPWNLVPPSLTPKKKFIFKNQINKEYDVIISCGRKSVIPSIVLKKNSNKKIVNIHIQNPKVSLENFDIVVAPDHDSVDGPNVLISKGAIHYLTLDEIHKAKDYLLSKIEKQKEVVTLILGGPTKYYNYDNESMIQIFSKINKQILEKNMQLIIIPSNRTPEKIIQFAKEYFSKNRLIVDSVDKQAYLSSLALAKYIIVTCDSSSMISEAALTGKPVYVAMIPAMRNDKRFQKFRNLLESMNIVRKLEDSLDTWSYEKLDETNRIAKQIKEKLF